MLIKMSRKCVLLMMSREFVLKVGYNGKFIRDPNLNYINAEIGYSMLILVLFLILS